MILAYRILISLFYPFLILLIYLRKIFNKEDPNRFKEKIFTSHFNVLRNKNKKLIWLHAASVGEFKSIIPVIKKLDNENFEFLITTTTLSSGNLAIEEFKDNKNIFHRYFPLDVQFLIKSFLGKWKPDRIFLIDSEIWPNLILIAKNKNIPIALLNARLTKKSYNRWIKFPRTAKKIFRLFNLCLTANLETKRYLENLDVKNVFFNGNIKLAYSINEENIKNVNANFLKSKRFWLAASTHQGEEKFCLNVHKKVREKYNDIITIIAPRHINRCEEISTLSNKLNLKTQILNDGELISNQKEIILINSFGALQEYFKYAKSVFIGKSILKRLSRDGGQNPIDAAKLQCKIYHGPYVYNFQEIYEIFEEKNITNKINSYEELSEKLIEDLKSPSKSSVKNLEFIEDLGKRTLNDTMKSINNFIE